MKTRDIRICVLQRGWIVVGDYSKEGAMCSVKNGAVIRHWATTAGLGELATQGPLSATKLDFQPETEWHEMTQVMSIKCNPDKWADVMGGDDYQPYEG